MNSSASALLQEGIGLHRQGKIAEAERRYQAVLQSDPSNADAYYYLGALVCQRGRFAECIDLARKAVAIDSGHARAHKLLAVALNRLGRNDEALAALDRAIAHDPNFAEAHGMRGDVLADLRRLSEAVESYRRALAIDPNAVADWCNLGAAQCDLGRYDEAVATFERLIALQPSFARAYSNRADALSKLDRNVEALADYDRAVALDQNNVDVHSNRAIVLRRLGREEEALVSLDRALAIKPAHIPALEMRANILVKRARYMEALAICDQVLARLPGNLNLLVTRCDALAGLGRPEEAIASADAALAIDPDHTGAKWNKSILLLSVGRFAEGWPLYKHRWAALQQAPRTYSQAGWDGDYCHGILLVWGEQGLGDQILYASMIPDLEDHADRVVLEVEKRLAPLFARSFPSVEVVAADAIGPDAGHTRRIDAHIALADLGGMFRSSWESFPQRELGYLRADPTLTQAIRNRLKRGRELVIGLSWRSVNPTMGASKTVALLNFEPLLRLPNTRFVDLQYGDTRQERLQVEQDIGSHIEHLDDIDNTNDIDGLAALISACDIVVTVSNTTAHLAGALGKPTWVFVPSGHARVWYWFRDRPYSPWYPRVHIYRQSHGQSWTELISAAALQISQGAAILEATGKAE